MSFLNMNTKPLKRLSLLAATVALIYAAASAWAFYRFQSMVRTLKYYGISESQQLELENVSQWRRSLTYDTIIFLMFAVAASAVALGLFRAKRWAGHAWYILVACFAAYHLFRLVTSYQLGAFSIAARVGEVLGSFLLAGLTLAAIYFNQQTSHESPPPPPTEWGEIGRTDT